jgi:hypothetical protein
MQQFFARLLGFLHHYDLGKKRLQINELGLGHWQQA